MNASIRGLAGAILVAGISGAVAAQEPAPKNEVTVWVMTYTNGGGWGAADKANKVGQTLRKLETVGSVVVDTTATAYIHAKEGSSLEKDALDKALEPLKSKVKTLEKTVRPKEAATFEIMLKGLAWSETAFEAREALIKLDHVLCVQPFGDTGKVVVLTKTADALTEEKVKGAFAGKDFQVKSFKKS